ncbi:MAG: metallophosphoesterase, partial [Desulfuromonadales bacterium]|nr:metallophosphoesterase [Desulfuromonadales bacterium]
MTLFLLSFVGIYGVMHYVVWRGVRPLLPLHPCVFPLVLGWVVLMMAAPLLSRLLERSGADLSARIAAWGGYLWLGFLFIAFALFALRALVSVLILLFNRSIPSLALAPLNAPASAIAVLGLTLLLGTYALYEASVIRIETVTIRSAALPPELPSLRIVQLSDLHLGLIHRAGTLRTVVEKIRKLQPDLLVATGDMVDARLDHLEELVPLTASLAPPLGKFAVTGNHEVYVGMKESLDFLQQGGFTVLRNQRIVIQPGLSIVGVDDPATGKAQSEAGLLPDQNEGFTLLLKHRPLVNASTLGRFDLQLSGHAHRGQLFPFNLLTRLHYPQQDGLYPLAPGAWLYASRGTGTWGPPMRLFSPP